MEKKKKDNRGKNTTKYKPEYDRMAYAACYETGATDSQLAKIFGVTKNTLRRWMGVHESFKVSVQKGKDEFNNRVAEDCLMKRIKGFDYTEKIKEINPETGELEVVRTVTKKVIPDATSLKFYLMNRDRKRWTQAQKIEIDVSKELKDHANRLMEARKKKDRVRNAD